jgi:hypothetical protein
VGEESRSSSEGGVAEALRAAIDRTLSAAGGSARTNAVGSTRERATQLLDEVARLGRDARDELARRGQDAREGLARRGQGAGAELARRGQGAAGEIVERLETLERRLTSLEQSLRSSDESKPKPKP